MSKGRHITWRAEEMAWIEANAGRPRREAHAEFCRIFGRPDVSLSNYAALCKRNGWFTGRTGRFKSGHVSHNKGKRGYSAPGSEKGWFTPGERRGVATKLYKPVGTERVSKDGYLERKIHDGMPLQSRWRAVHILNWEQVNGPLPKGSCLKCLDGDRTNSSAENWTAVPRALLPRLAGGRWGRQSYDEAPPELKPVLMTIAKLEHAARGKRKSK
jgi:hypothetical protein